MTPQESFSSNYDRTGSYLSAGGDVCPVCARAARDEYVSLSSFPEDLQKLIRANAPDTADIE